jgi:hypothetical protein
LPSAVTLLLKLVPDCSNMRSNQLPTRLDDYGWIAYDLQQQGADAFARAVSTQVLMLSTG